MLARLLSPAATTALALLVAVPVGPRLPGAPRTPARSATPAPADFVQEMMAQLPTLDTLVEATSEHEPDVVVDLRVLVAHRIAPYEAQLQGALLHPESHEVVGDFTIFIRQLLSRELASGDIHYIEWHLELFEHGAVEMVGTFPGRVRGVPGFRQAITGATGAVPGRGQALLFHGPEDVFLRLAIFFD